MSIAWCRQQQKRAAKELRKKNPPAWARLALFDAFTEELFLVGAFDPVGLREFGDGGEIHVSFCNSGKLTLSEVPHEG